MILPSIARMVTSHVIHAFQRQNRLNPMSRYAEKLILLELLEDAVFFEWRRTALPPSPERNNGVGRRERGQETAWRLEAAPAYGCEYQIQLSEDKTKSLLIY